MIYKEYSTFLTQIFRLDMCFSSKKNFIPFYYKKVTEKVREMRFFNIFI
jgi:hypothetical protein